MPILKSIFVFYRDGFRSMKLGRKLWCIIIIKLIVLFAILKLFFFPDHISEKAETQAESEANIVRSEILRR